MIGSTTSSDRLKGEVEGPLWPDGINVPYPSENAQFCLNAVHWPSGLMGDRAASEEESIR